MSSVPEPEVTGPYAPPAVPAAKPRRASQDRAAEVAAVPGPSKPRRAKADAGSGPALLELTAEVGGDTAVVWQFVSDYLDLLEHRVTAVTSAVSAGNAERAEVALLSLESTSLMVGADAIVRAVRPIRAAVNGVDFGAARSKLPALRRAQSTDRGRLERARAAHDSEH
ncbi:hypothetical protein [Microlunatus parietis]|uniref:Hpt domain-containing protein n=1 Tax=Microlunatus parietis TaxID=682979 RepID=A0A7Y9I5F2_9ACTN|nr:hypothetical protein [Microlunatus parietis]NYE70625.1 hypothetical protein [Microlunatus parietis]